MTDLVCPICRAPLRPSGERLACPSDHVFELRRGVPILLRPDVHPTQPGYWATGDEVHVDLAEVDVCDHDVHPYVRALLVGTCGNFYRGVELDRYPIPELRLPASHDRFLEIGSNWGRWCVAAARAGYSPTGVDPSYGAVRVAARVARQLDVEAEFLVADGRHLPFPDESFDVVFSYSVLQHLAKEDALRVFDEAARVLAPGGTMLVQMPNAFGLWNALKQARTRFRASNFEVRYWTPVELRRAGRRIGPVALEVDGFFSLNPQRADLELLRPQHRRLVRASEALRRMRPLTLLADSLYVRARKPSTMLSSDIVSSQSG